MRNCDHCHVLYHPLRVRSGDYHFTFCSASCQRDAGVISIRDLLSARRQFTDDEIAELVHAAELARGVPEVFG